MCNSGRCRHENGKGNCTKARPTERDCFGDDEYEAEPEYDPIEELEKEERKFERMEEHPE